MVKNPHFLPCGRIKQTNSMRSLTKKLLYLSISSHNYIYMPYTRVKRRVVCLWIESLKITIFVVRFVEKSLAEYNIANAVDDVWFPNAALRKKKEVSIV